MEPTTPAVQAIPINKIKPNPNNPRHVIEPQSVEALTASMRAVGQQTPIKVRPLKAAGQKGEREKGEKERKDNENAMPQIPLNPPLSNGEDFEYELIGGHLRLEAAKKLGWETLLALVLDVNNEQADLAAILDNRGEDMYWLDWHQAIEKRLAAPAQPTQQQVADELGIFQQEVSRGMGVLKYLNPFARECIYKNFVKPGGYEVPESCVRRLTDLVDPQWPIGVAQGVIEKALMEVLSRHMTEPQVTAMVEAMKNGLYPGDTELRGDRWMGKSGDDDCSELAQGEFAESVSGKAERLKSEKGTPSYGDPYAAYWKPLPKEVKVTQTRKGYRVVMDLSSSDAVPVVYGAMSNWEFLKGLSGEKEDLSYRQALPLVHKEAAKLRKLGMKNGELGVNDKGKKIFERSSTPQGRQSEAPATVKTFPVAHGAMGDGSADKTSPAPLSLEAERQRLSSEGGRNDGKDKPGPLGAHTKTLGEKLQGTPTVIEQNLEKDAKQAVNYQVRRGMRNFLRNLFN